MKTTESKILQIYVKSTSNCPQGLSLVSFEELSDTWTGESLRIPFETEEGKFRKHLVVGWTDLFFGSACSVSVTKVEINDDIGYLIHGGNSGLRVLDKKASREADKENEFYGIPKFDSHLPEGYGVPIIWIENERDLPREVLKIVGKL